ncbi:MAG TPA: hypothetical protein VK497_01080 [Candidatus Saccharimonadales bacterium]|nr:hypothetical protein [Candidatus Saccharimonadales bacterium]
MNIQDEHPDDAVNIAPHLHAILFEDDKLRVLKVSVKPGDEAKMHWHPRNINYVLSAGKLGFTKPDGSSVDIDLSEGQVTSSVESSHEVKNIGDTIVETVQVELKD